MDKLNGRTDHRWIYNTEHIETIKNIFYHSIGNTNQSVK